MFDDHRFASLTLRSSLRRRVHVSRCVQSVTFTLWPAFSFPSFRFSALFLVVVAFLVPFFGSTLTKLHAPRTTVAEGCRWEASRPASKQASKQEKERPRGRQPRTALNWWHRFATIKGLCVEEAAHHQGRARERNKVARISLRPWLMIRSPAR